MINFNKAFVINLRRRPERLKAFYDQAITKTLLPEWNLERFEGIEETPPDGYTLKQGVWGCYRSHLKLLETIRDSDWNEVVIFEDDALFAPAFLGRYKKVDLPDDWEMFYLGGQPLEKTYPVAHRVVRCANVNRTHAYAVKKSVVDFLIDELSKPENFMDNHVDTIYGKLHPQLNVYLCSPPLVGQTAGQSDVNGRMHKERYWG